MTALGAARRGVARVGRGRGGVNSNEIYREVSLWAWNGWAGARHAARSGSRGRHRPVPACRLVGRGLAWARVYNGQGKTVK